MWEWFVRDSGGEVGRLSFHHLQKWNQRFRIQDSILKRRKWKKLTALKSMKSSLNLTKSVRVKSISKISLCNKSDSAPSFSTRSLKDQREPYLEGRLEITFNNSPKLRHESVKVESLVPHGPPQLSFQEVRHFLWVGLEDLEVLVPLIFSSLLVPLRLPELGPVGGKEVVLKRLKLVPCPSKGECQHSKNTQEVSICTLSSYPQQFPRWNQWFSRTSPQRGRRLPLEQGSRLWRVPPSPEPRTLPRPLLRSRHRRRAGLEAGMPAFPFWSSHHKPLRPCNFTWNACKKVQSECGSLH